MEVLERHFLIGAERAKSWVKVQTTKTKNTNFI